jgi:hypothetical protein
VLEAVRCVIDVTKGLAERYVGIPPDRHIEVCTGIHLGDVVEEADGDLMARIDRCAGRRRPSKALSRQISIGDFRRRIRPSALAIREQKQWSSILPWCASRQYRFLPERSWTERVEHCD